MLRRRLERGSSVPTVQQIVDAHDLLAMRESVEQVTVHDDVLRYVVSLATATAFLRPSVATGALTGAAAAIRLALHFQGRRIFAPAVRATPWLIPLRDLLELAVWCAGSTGRNVRWRTARYTITSRGRIKANEGATSAPSSRAGRRNGQTPLQ